jgi:hypothetical protein
MIVGSPRCNMCMRARRDLGFEACPNHCDHGGVNPAKAPILEGCGYCGSAFSFGRQTHESYILVPGKGFVMRGVM